MTTSVRPPAEPPGRRRRRRGRRYRHPLDAISSGEFVAAAVCFGLGLRLALEAGLLGLPLGVILLGYLFKYAYVVLEQRALGEPGLPLLSLEMVNPVDEWRPWQQLAIVAGGFSVVRWAADTGGSPAAWALGGAGLFLLPASIAVLGVTRRGFDAVDPRMLIGLVRAMGIGYLGLAAVAYATVAAMLVLARSMTALGLVAAVACLLGGFHVLGVLLYRRRAVLGLATRRSPEQSAERAERSEAQVFERTMAEAWGMASRGNPRGARAVLDAWIDAQGASARRRAERVHARLCTWPDPCDRLLISRRLIELELADGRLPEARRIAAECVSLDPAFEPRPEQLPQTLEELPPRSEIGHGSR